MPKGGGTHQSCTLTYQPTNPDKLIAYEYKGLSGTQKLVGKTLKDVMKAAATALLNPGTPVLMSVFIRAPVENVIRAAHDALPVAQEGQEDT